MATEDARDNYEVRKIWREKKRRKEEEDRKKY